MRPAILVSESIDAIPVYICKSIARIDCLLLQLLVLGLAAAVHCDTPKNEV